ncbi:MAG: hypothetical protein N2Z81_04370 [Hydrogenothermaceae bacterium]|nr:hypothetical protein [Hydrogenothermaceae bacterium]
MSAIEVLLNCTWPGNIRELENCIERAFVITRGEYLTADSISCIRGDICYSHLLESEIKRDENMKFIPLQNIYINQNKDQNLNQQFLEDNENKEKDRIIKALEKTGWVQAKAARILGMTVRQLNYRIQKYNIEVKKL